ncbi:hypothetical protein [Brevibacillus centrosporus]|uniref:hypothetical protein n=1 Tax=Brevibacillus centrosporus TaxID=54910 RepID=UPI003B016DCC
MSNDVTKQFFGESKREFDDAVSKRFFSYSLERKNLRKDFELDLLKLLGTMLPEERDGKLDDAIANYKDNASRLFSDEIK